MSRFFAWAIALAIPLLLGSTAKGQLRPRPEVIKPANTIVDPALHNLEVITVKFNDGLMIRAEFGELTDRGSGDLAPALPALGQLAGGTWEQAHLIDEALMDELRLTAQDELQWEIADLNLQFHFVLPVGLPPEFAIDLLNSVEIVELAQPIPLPTEPPVPPNYQANQGYLQAATAGVDAVCMWNVYGGTGAFNAMADLEYSWNLSHNDLNASLLGSTPNDPFSDDNHGTAVLGEVNGLNDGLGVTGISHASTMHVVATNTGAGAGVWNIGAAITTALATLNAGDVILIEQQYAGPAYTGTPPGTQVGMIPVEWYLPWYNAIVLAVGNGVVVVEAAGNGSQNLDAALYSTGNAGHWPFLPANDSGAIIVGAGASPGGSDVDRSRLSFSDYGSTVDLQGWGENVFTTGYGSAYSTDGKNYWYTAGFNGTSSASPIVAGAVATLQSAHIAATGSPLTAAQTLTALQTTGSPQQAGTHPVSQNIGSLPDASAAFAWLLPVVDNNSNLVPDICDAAHPLLEACCLPAGGCVDAVPQSCTNAGGSNMGAGSICTPLTCTMPALEACCFPDGSCQDLTIAACAGSGGAPVGPGSNCATAFCPAPPEACCFPDGSCQDLTIAACTGIGGAPVGPGSNCATAFCPAPPEACCLPDDQCIFIPPFDCIMQGGAFPSSAICYGDNDGDGFDDACQFEPFEIEFSVDIGSDTELSDPFFNGNEGFDPGDVYLWHSPPVVPMGRDGFKDDQTIFLQQDPWPDPPDFAMPPATAVPVGLGNPAMYHDFFDIDGHDQIDFSLQQLVNPQAALTSRIVYAPGIHCVHASTHLVVSYDDDMQDGWPVNDVPVMVPSPAGLSSHGTTAGMDEVFGWNTLPGPMGLLPIMPYPFADEAGIHADFIPNPDAGDMEDDDVDSLDVVLNPADCSTWLFSPDHEGTFVDMAGNPLDPGDIYEVTPVGPVPVIDDVIHLGLPPDTDVDAFELIWWADQMTGGVYLVLLFSVDDNDALTPGDESGGLVPVLLYGSYLDGTYFQATEFALDDDVDALSAYRHSLEHQEACCMPDGSCQDWQPSMCFMRGGTPLGTGSSCATSSCQGACCWSDGTCTDGSADACSPYVCNVWNLLPSTFSGCLADVDGSGVVNASDRGFVSANIGQTAPDLLCVFDLDGSGVINASDRGIVSANVSLCAPLPNFQDGSGLNAAGTGPDPRFPQANWMGYNTQCASITCP